MASEAKGSPAPSVTIGFFARERFSWAPTALRALLDSTTDIDYRLVIVDSLTPAPYLAELETMAAGRENIEFMRAGRHLLPNEARNLVAEACTTEYVALIENDVVVTPGWLTRPRRGDSDLRRGRRRTADPREGRQVSRRRSAGPLLVHTGRQRLQARLRTDRR